MIREPQLITSKQWKCNTNTLLSIKEVDCRKPMNELFWENGNLIINYMLKGVENEIIKTLEIFENH